MKREPQFFRKSVPRKHTKQVVEFWIKDMKEKGYTSKAKYARDHGLCDIVVQRLITALNYEEL